MPFTPDQFFDLFEEYNRQFLIVAAGFWLTCLMCVASTWRNPARWSRLLTYLLAALWAWTAIAYHAVLFTRINPAAWLFAALFLVQAVLLAWIGARQQFEYFSPTGPIFVAGVGLMSYSFMYPFLSALSHAYPATPTFGVPCPTTILTIGLLLTLRGRIPVALAIVPAIWGVIGGSAAVLLAVPTDYGLLGAALLLIVTLVAQRLRPMLLRVT